MSKPEFLLTDDEIDQLDVEIPKTGLTAEIAMRLANQAVARAAAKKALESVAELLDGNLGPEYNEGLGVAQEWVRGMLEELEGSNEA